MTTELTTNSPQWQAWADAFLDNSPEHLEPPDMEMMGAVTLIIMDELLSNSRIAFEVSSDAATEKPILMLPMKRLEVLGMADKADVSVIPLIGALANSPGEMVMWAHAVARLAQRTGDVVSASGLLIHFGENGLPSPARLEALWGMQKVGAANMLDRVVAAPADPVAPPVDKPADPVDPARVE